MPLTLRNNNFLSLATCIHKHEHINEVPLINIVALKKHWTKKEQNFMFAKRDIKV
jgi:hypothetical protein